MTDYAQQLEKFVILTGGDEKIMNDYSDAPSLRFIGNGQAIINTTDYNKIIDNALADSLIDQYESDCYYGAYEPN
jgi:hypothetical protein